MWDENNQCKIFSKDIYLEKDKFIKLCNDLNVDANNRLLEIYEKNDLIYPVYRIIRQEDYLQIIFEQSYNSFYRTNNIIEVPDKYGDLLQFEYEKLNNWYHPIFPQFHSVLKDGHPLDQAYKLGESFIEKPSKENYKKWDEYIVEVKANIETTQIKEKKSIARLFYSPWQIYLLEEANRKHTRKVNVLIPLKEDEKYILQEPPQKLTLTQWNEYFKSLWEYRFKEDLLFEKYLNSIDGHILEGEPAKNFHEERKKIAENIYFHHSYKSWIKFLRALCGLYFDYQNREKIKLSLCVKKDVKFIIDILRFGAEKKYREIINDVGMVVGNRTFCYISPLENIYPEYESYLRREAKLSLDSVLKSYNTEMPEELKLNTKEIDAIIDYAFKSGNETMLTSIIGINKEYFSPSYIGEEALWSFVRSLAVAVEAWVKTISGIELNGNSDFCKAINKLLNGYYECINNKYNILQKRCGKLLNISNLKCWLSELSSMEIEKGFLWIKHILRAYIIRNYIAHHTKIDSNLFGNNFKEIYTSLLFLAFYSWKVMSHNLNVGD